MRIPTVHLNGTSGHVLENYARYVVDALNKTLDAIHAAAPNARDFYVQEDGDTAFRRATVEHLDRQARVMALRDEYSKMFNAIHDQVEARKR